MTRDVQPPTSSGDRCETLHCLAPAIKRGMSSTEARKLCEWVDLNYLEEGAESDVRKVVVSTVPSALRVRLLPKLNELVLQLTDRTQVEDVITRKIVVECRVVCVQTQPEEKLHKYTSSLSAHAVLSAIQQYKKSKPVACLLDTFVSSSCKCFLTEKK